MKKKIIIAIFIILAAVLAVSAVLSFKAEKVAGGIILLALLFLYALPQIAAIIFYEKYFCRYETRPPFKKYIEDYEGLQVKEVDFKSDKGQNLKGYIYGSEGVKATNALIVCHGLGGGGGHNSYMKVIDYFTKEGFKVFSYDATGTDKSEGEGMQGLPQGLIDLSYAIDYVKKSEEFKNYKISLFGHSFGAYSVSSVLNVQPEVYAVCELAGFNKSYEMMKYHGKSLIGNFINLAIYFIIIYERLKFGKYANYDAITGFSHTNAKIMAVQGENDDVVPAFLGFDKYYEKFKDDSRFSFLKLKDKGHENIYYSLSSSEYINNFFKEYQKYAADKNLSQAEREEYMLKNFDKARAFNYDYEVLEKISEFLK